MLQAKLILNFKNGKLIFRLPNRKCRMNITVDKVSNKMFSARYDHNHGALSEHLTQLQKISSILKRTSEENHHENPTY
jgi:hypothetical protein